MPRVALDPARLADIGAPPKARNITPQAPARKSLVVVDASHLAPSLPLDELDFNKPRTPVRPASEFVPVTAQREMSFSDIPPLTQAGRLPFIYRATAAKGFVPSLQQFDFFQWVRKGFGNCLLEAVAGAGKTTTLVQALPFMDGDIFLGAYNKKIAEDIKRKAEKERFMRQGIFINTMHGSGFYDWRRVHKDVRVEDKKLFNLIEQEFGRDYIGKNVIRDLASFGKQMLAGYKFQMNDAARWRQIIDHFGMAEDLPPGFAVDRLIRETEIIMVLSLAQCDKVIDFDDMIYAPILHNRRPFTNQWVLVDERQDTNPARREWAKKLLDPRDGRFVGVGDSRQAIYGWTGADGSTEEFVKEFGCVILPLTVTYRCPKAVVNYVRQWVSHIEAHPDAPEGVVREIKCDLKPKACAECEGEGHHMIQGEFPVPCRTCKGKRYFPTDPWFVQDAPTQADVILCRFTRPLIKTAYALIKAGVACKVEGRDIGNGLLKIVFRWKIRTLVRLEEKLKEYLASEVAKARVMQNEAREQEITDRVETIKLFIDRTRERGGSTIDNLAAEIQSVFADDITDMLTLSTGHKAKGREWPRVFWLQAAVNRPGLKPWEVVQETNINYVIGTRAMSELVLVPQRIHSP